MNPVSWRQSSYCQESASCVNVARGERDTIVLRESEQPEVILTTTRTRLRTFISAAKAGQFDHIDGAGR
ncbi:DUF397 domain-containing protein [Streptomyces malaysiensis]|uniref:DUF397 domain-containing protein n=1 Tax=Streptomyces malaysiensis subsp. samsunensis TaxID=459658 RepID=A0A9X2M0Z1_STRMQ|nr:DUF397 domain-containing protein [Streptomyces samsunensis]MCQ8831319.1 DUF397 domain-containing protein [Streptomyces samsunensis]